MTLNKFKFVFAFSMVLMVMGIAYMVVYAGSTSTYQTFGFIVFFALWIIFCVEYGGRLQKRAQQGSKSE